MAQWSHNDEKGECMFPPSVAQIGSTKTNCAYYFVRFWWNLAQCPFVVIKFGSINLHHFSFFLVFLSPDFTYAPWDHVTKWTRGFMQSLVRGFPFWGEYKLRHVSSTCIHMIHCICTAGSHFRKCNIHYVFFQPRKWLGSPPPSELIPWYHAFMCTQVLKQILIFMTSYVKLANVI